MSRRTYPVIIPAEQVSANLCVDASLVSGQVRCRCKSCVEASPAFRVHSGPDAALIQQRKQQQAHDKAADMRFPGDAGLFAEYRHQS
jgi:hypothetical protein